MRKAGVPLHVLPGFTEAIAARLRDQLSVSTADEFVDLATRFPDSVRNVAGVGEHDWEQLVQTAATHVSTDLHEEILKREGGTYPFKTGFDPPKDRDGNE
jgi:hypothetical protein